MHRTLLNVTKDAHCDVCDLDCVETVVDDRGDVIFVKSSCCGEEIEWLHTDFIDLIDGE